MPGIHSLCLHPQEPRRILLAVSCGGVWHSHDAGGSWELWGEGLFADFRPPGRRDDPAIQDPHRIVQCASAPERIWCQHRNGVFRSDNGGRTFTEIDTVKPSVFGFAVAVHPLDPDTAWLVPAQKDAVRVPVDAKVVVSRTRDGGRSWEVLDRGLPPPPAYDISFRHALDVDETGARLAFRSTTGSVWITEDGGDRWSCLASHLPPVYAVRFA